MCIISICSILILISILRSLTQSYVRQHRMKTPSKELLTIVGVDASIFPKSTVTLKYGMVNASWVSTVTDSNPTVPFYCQKIQPESNLQTVTHNPHSFPWGSILEESTKNFLMSFFNHVQLHQYDLTNAGISQACYDELIASGNNSTEDQLRILADSMREDFKDYMRPLFQ